jgi:hypothetical protein
MSQSVRESGASVVVTFKGVVAANHIDAIKTTEARLRMCRDILALRQLQRGTISGFLVVQEDATAVRLFSEVRRPYPILRKVHNLPLENEGEIFLGLYLKSERYPLLKVYLSLYADALSNADTLITELSTETRLLRLWTLLEAMAFSERGSNKKEKVRALFNRYRVSKIPNYRNHSGRDLLDIAYEWRNVIAHAGGCRGTIKANDVRFCKEFHSLFDEILEDLSSSSRMLVYLYANSLPLDKEEEPHT